MDRRMSYTLGALMVAAALASPAAISAQTKKKPTPQAAPASTFRGCLQGDTAKGFALTSPTGNGSDDKGQMKTYKVVPGANSVDLTPLTNKIVEVTGSLSTAASKTGKIPSPDVMGDRKVTDSNRSEPSTVAEGMKVWADGTLRVTSIRQLENSCAARSDRR
jgi:hypothetical protein